MAARQEVAEKLFTDDVRYTDPLMDVPGPAALATAIGAARHRFPGWRFHSAGPADGHHHQVRFGWELGPEGAGEAPVVGFDVAVLTADSRISHVLGFLDSVPS